MSVLRIRKKNINIVLLGMTSIFVVLFMSFLNSAFAASINATITAGIFVPGSPANLATTVGDQSVALSWSPPVSNGGSAITDYVIEYKLSSGSTWSTFSDGVGTGASVTVTSLSNDNSYDFRVSAVNAIGQGSASSNASAMPGSPAQVLIQGFGDLTVPSIVTNVWITNEGSAAYEYQYTWCVTDSDTNLCGGGNDVFSSSAAKLIQAGESWDTSLSSTVSTVGNYWFHLDVQFGSDSSHASQSLTAVAEAVATPPSSGGGGGGGEGGGSVPLTPSIPSTACIGADFNHDNKVSSVDFSILLAFWKTSPPFKNTCVDINGDNQVNSIDFSIFLYQWGKKPIPFR